MTSVLIALQNRLHACYAAHLTKRLNKRMTWKPPHRLPTNVLPCPWCGGTRLDTDKMYSTSVSVVTCAKCRATVPLPRKHDETSFEFNARALATWNNRAGRPPAHDEDEEKPE